MPPWSRPCALGLRCVGTDCSLPASERLDLWARMLTECCPYFPVFPVRLTKLSGRANAWAIAADMISMENLEFHLLIMPNGHG